MHVSLLGDSNRMSNFEVIGTRSNLAEYCNNRGNIDTTKWRQVVKFTPQLPQWDP
jgi:hypothetical protein